MDRRNDGRNPNGRPDGAKRPVERRPRGAEPRDKGRPGGGRPGASSASRGKRISQGPSARDVALHALRDVARNGAYAAQALDRALRDAQLSEADRRLAASLFYFTLENRLRIECCLSARLKEKPGEGEGSGEVSGAANPPASGGGRRIAPEILDILCLAAAQILFMDKIPDHAAVDEAVKQTRRAGRESLTGLVNAVLRGLIRDRDEGKLTLPDRAAEPEEYLCQRYSLAPELAQRLIAAYGLDEAERIVAWSPERGVETVRPNRLRLSDAEFEDWLKANRLEWSRGIVPGAYRVAGAGRLASHAGYRGGLFSIQGESSMLAALAVEAKPGMQILDACAAPGGKSCLMAEAMRGAGRVHAWDVHEHRVELIQSAARRLGLDNLRPQLRDASIRNANLDGMMDAVLVDAPCSGLGVIGDKPDIKYKLTSGGVAALAQLQGRILDTCAAYVRPGGLLVYSTCTLLPEENALQAEGFLARHPEFEPDEGAGWLPEALRAHWRSGQIQILPGRDALDGFFIARFRRKAGNYGG